MKYKIIISGFGGQDVSFAGKILTRASELSGCRTFRMPSHISEMRGEGSSCKLIIEKEAYAKSASAGTDILIAMDKRALIRFSGNANGLIVTDEQLSICCKQSANTVYLNTDLCACGKIFDGLTNAMMIGAMLSGTDIIRSNDVHKAIEEVVGGSAVKRVCDAVEYGRQRAYRKSLMREII